MIFEIWTVQANHLGEKYYFLQYFEVAFGATIEIIKNKQTRSHF